MFRRMAYIHHRGAFSVARFDKLGNAKALHREASDRDWLHVFFVYVLSLFRQTVAVVAKQHNTIYIIFMREMNGYEAPQVEIIEVEVEKGFATSTDLEPTPGA